MKTAVIQKRTPMGIEIKAVGNGEGRLKVEYLPLDQLKPWSANPQIHSPEQVAEIGRSIAGFGMVKPILVRRADHEVITGHGRLYSLKSAGATEVPVILLDLPKNRAHALALALNKIAEKSPWDAAKLSMIFVELKDLGADVELTGFTAEEINAYTHEEKPETAAGEDAVPARPKKPVTKTGDLWTLGSHRLLCGDVNDLPAVKGLIGGEKLVMVFSDPPYDLPMETVWAAFAVAKRLSPLVFWMGSDKQMGMLANDKSFAHFFVYLYPAPYILSNHRPASGHTLIGKFGNGPMVNLHDAFATVIKAEINKNEFGHHEKALKLVEEFLLHYTKKDNAMGDLFSGSGSTLIACEKNGRRARSIELDPGMCDVIVERWQQFSGGKARREKA